MRLFLSLFVTTWYFNTTAQNKTFEKYVGWNGHFVTLQTIQNKTQACTFVLRSDSIRAFFTTGNNQYEELFTVPRSLNENFLGGFTRDRNVYLFMDNGANKGIRCWLYNATEKKVTENQIPFEIKNSRIINRLSSDNYFFYFTYNKKTTEFVIYKFNNETGCDTMRYADNSGLWEKVTNDKLFFREINVERADMEGECSVDIAQSRNKIYVRNDTLLLIVNSVAGHTNVYNFDLVSGKVNERSIKHVSASDYPEPTVYNSFLMKNKLFFCSAGRNALNLQVLDFYSGKLINEFYTNGGEEISFINTNIASEGRKLTNDATPAEGKTKQLLKQMAKGSVVIIAQPLDKDTLVVLTIASFREIQQPGSWSMGVGGSPGVFMPGSNWVQSTRFKTMLNAASYEHVKGVIPPLINERINEYIKDIKMNDTGQKLVSMNGGYSFFYYDKREKTLNAVKFDK